MEFSNIEIAFYKFLSHDTSIEDFEQWVYATPEIEKMFGTNLYEELIEMKYQKSGVKNDLWKLVEKEIDPIKFDTWVIMQQLKMLADQPTSLQLVSKNLDQYSYRYTFIFGICDAWNIIKQIQTNIFYDKYSKQEKEDLINESFSEASLAATMCLAGFETGELKIIGEEEIETKPGFFDNINEVLAQKRVERKLARPPETSFAPINKSGTSSR